MSERKPIGLEVPYRQVIDKSAAKRIATVARPWVGLTDEEINYFIVHRLRIATKENLTALIRVCEAKLKEKNT